MRFESTFDRIYAADLVYAPDCWQLCGNAHCCNFSRYKSQMSILGHHRSQEIPLLPGEFDFICARSGASAEPIERRSIEFPIGIGAMKIDFLVASAKNCACEHDTRTTICRLYPLLPVFDISGKLIEVDRQFGMYEEIEAIDSAERACKIETVPFGELGKFAAICHAIGENPTHLFYMMAFRLAKAQATQNLIAAKQSAGQRGGVTTLRIFEGLFALNRLLDPVVMRAQLDALAAQFAAHYGDAFTLA